MLRSIGPRSCVTKSLFVVGSVVIVVVDVKVDWTLVLRNRLYTGEPQRSLSRARLVVLTAWNFLASKGSSKNLNTGPAENRKPKLHSKHSCYDDSTGFERMMMLCYQRQYPNWRRIFRFLNRLRGRCFKPCLPLASLSCVAASTRLADRPSL